MRKYLELFTENFPADIANKLSSSNWPYVAYSVTEDRAIHAAIPEPEEPDPTASYVDLGLSVMWASCNLGANSPEEVGNYYRFGDPLGYTKNDDVFGSGTGYTGGSGDWDITVDPVFINSEIPDKNILLPHVPSASEISELVNNTVQTLETVNGINGIRFTATNGNSIFMPTGGILQSTTSYLDGWFSYWSRTQTSIWISSGVLVVGQLYAAPGETASYDPNANAYNGLPVRGVCRNLPQGGAEFLKRGTTVTIQPEQLYCFPKTWTATQILAAASEQLTVHISNVADFVIGDENVLMSRPAFLEGSQRAVYLSGEELANLAEQATGDYLYVRFSCVPSTKVSINAWEASECADKSYMIPVNEAVRIEANNSIQVYRLRYADLQGAELKIKWGGNGTIKPYISYTCNYLFSETQYLLLNPAPNIGRRGTKTISADEVNAWASRVNADGFIYVHFSATSAGNITFAVEKPADVDPVSTTSLTSTDCGCAN